MKNHRVLVFPASAKLALFGDDKTEPTIPAPDGGWGVPCIAENGDMAFGLPAEHITPALAAHITKTASVKAREHTTDWSAKLAFAVKVEPLPVKGTPIIKR